jgi:hypothetical protein
MARTHLHVGAILAISTVYHIGAIVAIGAIYHVRTILAFFTIGAVTAERTVGTASTV